jgi:hypothetical protein
MLRKCSRHSHDGELYRGRCTKTAWFEDHCNSLSHKTAFNESRSDVTEVSNSVEEQAEFWLLPHVRLFRPVRKFRTSSIAPALSGTESQNLRVDSQNDRPESLTPQASSETQVSGQFSSLSSNPQAASPFSVQQVSSNAVKPELKIEISIGSKQRGCRKSPSASSTHDHDTTEHTCIWRNDLTRV